MSEEKKPQDQIEEQDDTKPKATKSQKPKRYFILNPGGAIHEVSAEQQKALLGRVGYRKATKAQITKYLKQKTQRFDAPIGEPFTAEPEGVEI